MKARSTSFSLPVALAAVLGCVLWLASSAPGAAANVQRAFLPIKKTTRTMTFAPRGVDPGRVRYAVVRMRRGKGLVRRRIGVSRVRHALRHKTRIRVYKAEKALPHALVLKLTSPVLPSSSRPPGACGSGTYGGFGGASRPAACWRPYSSSSPFNTPLPASTTPAADSEAIVKEWLSTWSGADKSSAPRFGVGDAGTADEYDHPVYWSGAGDPIYTVHCTERWGRCPIEGDQVHIPAGAEAAGGEDGHMAVMDQTSGFEYDFWRTGRLPAGGGTVEIAWGGRTAIGGEGLGAEATAGGFGLDAGVISPEELAAGEIDHALFIVVKCTDGTAVWPARGSGRSCASIGLPNAGAPAMGQHLYLEMTEGQIEALSDPAWQKTILRAMARYGMYVGDTGGGFLKLESGVGWTSLGLAEPWVPLAQQLGIKGWKGAGGRTEYQFDLSGAVDWSRYLRVAG